MNNCIKETCDLCGLPLRRGRAASLSGDRTFYFCCVGCRQVFQMLLEASDQADPASFRETEVFKKCREIGLIPKSEAELEKLNGPARDAQGEAEDRALSLHLKVGLMWCPACAWVIEETLKRSKGVLDASCNFSTDRALCRYDPILTSPSRVMGLIDSMGYRAAPPDEGPGQREVRGEFICFGISAFLTVNVMMLSFGLYSGFFTQLSPMTVSRLSWPIFIMASVVLFYGGHRIIRRAWAGVTQAAFSMETLITAGSLSAYLYSTYNLIFEGSIHLYYDTASMLITLVLLGKALEGKAKRGVQEGLEALLTLRPTKVRIRSGAFPGGRYVAADRLERGDEFWSGEGEILPADGVVLQGAGAADESTLTGESVPVQKKTGDRLLAGTRILHGTFRTRAERVGDESTFGQMIGIMEKALGTRAGFEGKTDIVLQWFVPIILLLAVGTGVACLVSGLSQGEAIIRAVTVMVISCPCTLGVAVPLARVAGISLAGKRGILVRDFAAFERAGRVSAFVFDKTGTMTHGQWEMLKIKTFPPFKEDEALALAAALEEDSDHTIAVTIRGRAGEHPVRPAEVKDIRPFKNGISGRFGDKEVRIGSRDFIAKPWNDGSVESPGGLIEDEAQHSTVYMTVGNRPCARFLFGDRIREGSVPTVRELLARGCRVALISGDGIDTTRAIAREIGVKEAHGEKLPQAKAAFIMALQRGGHHVAMIGDGINDAPALLQADLAMSVHSGRPLGNEASDLTLMRGDPAQVLDFIALAGKVNQKITQNLVCSFVYNLIAIPIAMSGLLTPLIAVCVMLLSSLAVTGNTLLLVKEKDLERQRTED